MINEWPQAVTFYEAWMLAEGSAETTIRIYRNYLKRLAATTQKGPYDITGDDLVMFVGRRRWKPETRKSARAALRSFYSWAHVTSRVQENPALLLRPVRVPKALPRPCPEAALQNGLQCAKCLRDKLILMLAAYAGMRRGEIAVAHTDDISGGVIRVHGKGGKDRDVPLHPVLANVLGQWPRGYVFPGLVDGHMAPDSIGHIGSDLLAAGWTLHTLRHRFLTLAYKVDRDVRAVQELAGHAKLDTAMVYTQVPDGALLRAVMAAGPTVAAVA